MKNIWQRVLDVVLWPQSLGTVGRKQTMDNIYTERNRLVALLASEWPSLIAPDPEDPDYHIVYISIPTGQVSWHIPHHDIHMFRDVKKAKSNQGLWDGHSTEEKHDRIRILTELNNME